MITEHGEKPSLYCYFGCCHFKTRRDLMEHLYEEHTKIDLECWGLNRDLLGKFVKAEDDKVHL